MVKLWLVTLALIGKANLFLKRILIHTRWPPWAFPALLLFQRHLILQTENVWNSWSTLRVTAASPNWVAILAYMSALRPYSLTQLYTLCYDCSVKICSLARWDSDTSSLNRIIYRFSAPSWLGCVLAFRMCFIMPGMTDFASVCVNTFRLCVCDKWCCAFQACWSSDRVEAWQDWM
jgi:hypothetical protein